MSVVLHLYVCPFLSERVERKLYLYETPIILIMLHVLCILCDIMLFGVILHLSFKFGKNIPTTYQNSPKLVFSLFLWVQAFGFV